PFLRRRVQQGKPCFASSCPEYLLNGSPLTHRTSKNWKCGVPFRSDKVFRLQCLPSHVHAFARFKPTSTFQSLKHLTGQSVAFLGCPEVVGGQSLEGRRQFLASFHLIPHHSKRGEGF